MAIPNAYHNTPSVRFERIDGEKHLTRGFRLAYCHAISPRLTVC